MVAGFVACFRKIASFAVSVGLDECLHSELIPDDFGFIEDAVFPLLFPVSPSRGREATGLLGKSPIKTVG